MSIGSVKARLRIDPACFDQADLDGGAELQGRCEAVGASWVSDHAEASRDIRARIEAVLETVRFDARGIQAAGRVSTCPPGSRNSDNSRLRMLLIAAYSTGRHESKESRQSTANDIYVIHPHLGITLWRVPSQMQVDAIRPPQIDPRRSG